MMSKLCFHFLILFSFLWVNKVHSQCIGSYSGYFPHPSQCDKYLVCENGKAVEEKLCPDGLVFEDWGHPTQIKCQLPINIDCSNRPQLQPAQSTAECPRANGMYPYEEDCTMFKECSEGVAHYKKCPQGLAYNAKTGTCDWPENTDGCLAENLLGFTCPEASAEEVALYGHPRYPHQSDCAKLFACVATSEDYYGKRSPRLLGCDFGLVFNPDTKTCDEPENVRGCESYYSDGLDARRSYPELTATVPRTDTRSSNVRRQPAARQQPNNTNRNRNQNVNTRNDGRYYG